MMTHAHCVPHAQIGEELERKLKRERLGVCLNCKEFLNCENVGNFEECGDFVEVEDEAWVIRKI